ncbi:hypothetical protein ACFFKH_04220 [Micromonospora marina]|uniref:Uncharacterized protein n=1 Tax=Micromonospora marina TaxID=307120 RepID=A0A1C4ZKU2_9ACTN|nr:hypothetical protein [Micromonospora marina]SCF33613.1 hypothetical protein GA0070215_11877 [Micromonospora marina]
MVTRFQADQDLRVLAEREGFPLDPSQHTGYSRSLSADGRTAKAVFDCTVPYAQRDRFRRPRFIRAVASRTAPASSATPSLIRAVGSAAYPIRNVGSGGGCVTK